MGSRVLILFAHPAFHRSRVHRALVEVARKLEGITFHDLYEAYPDLYVNVAHEQRLLVEHDVIIWQHPFAWYSAPAIIREWQDLVLEHGFAYGDKGTALHGKRALTVITTGGPSDSYQRDGFNFFSIRELLAPFEQTARLCGVEYLDPFIVHGTHRLTREEIEQHAGAYRQRIETLRDSASARTSDAR